MIKASTYGRHPLPPQLSTSETGAMERTAGSSRGPVSSQGRKQHAQRGRVAAHSGPDAAADTRTAGTCRRRTYTVDEAAHRIAHYLRMRRQRQYALGADVFSDPCWDMLLDLFVQTAKGVDVSVKSACLASGVPCTTALGYVSILEREGLLTRLADQADRRRTFLRLSDEAASSIKKWVEATFER